ncbi:hypothetical protein Glove_212g131 [Diversispora epigaea]|uniref:Uncharacterized protein n=1 Tax=Diversispora epigaea TaxID=1348612 RepID=A0A397IPB1_9GLOM|nr:hypothetical protein Glove_212g131 [Diversispora epigaea]
MRKYRCIANQKAFLSHNVYSTTVSHELRSIANQKAFLSHNVYPTTVYYYIDLNRPNSKFRICSSGKFKIITEIYELLSQEVSRLQELYANQDLLMNVGKTKEKSQNILRIKCSLVLKRINTNILGLKKWQVLLVLLYKLLSQEGTSRNQDCIAEAWNNISCDTILNCWKKTDIVESSQFLELDNPETPSSSSNITGELIPLQQYDTQEI